MITATHRRRRPVQMHLYIGGSSMASTIERAMAAGATIPQGTHAGRTVVSAQRRIASTW